jgi:hypothetical protein
MAIFPDVKANWITAVGPMLIKKDDTRLRNRVREVLVNFGLEIYPVGR